MRKTKIVVTIGPSTNSPKSIEELILRGVNVFRLNFSHSIHSEHKKVIDTIREISKKLNKSVGILQDISGPKIRIGELEKPLVLKKGDNLYFIKEGEYSENSVSINHPKVLSSVKEGDLIYLADGIIRVRAIKVTNDKIDTEVLVGGELTSKKGVNFPLTTLDMPSITKKDIEDIKFGIDNDVDFMALSFIQSAQDILTVKDIIKSYEKNIFVIPKIEKLDAITNLDDILNVSDGVMVARGDLGVELGVERVPKMQKMIIKKANQLGKPVITATQMLTSMIKSPYPTRAEISDIANAVLDGTDAVMLSDETAMGEFPLKAVDVLNDTINDIESIYPYHNDFNHVTFSKEALASSANNLSKSIDTGGIIVFTRSGRGAKAISKYRPKADILVNCCSEKVFRQLSIYWGIKPAFLTEQIDNTDELIYQFLIKAVREDFISKDKSYILMIGNKTHQTGYTNSIRLVSKEDITDILENHTIR